MSSSIFLCFANVSRDPLEPRSVTGYDHIQSYRILVAVVDGMSVCKNSPNSSIFYSLRALTNVVVVSLSQYSYLLFKMCKAYADLDLLVFICLHCSL